MYFNKYLYSQIRHEIVTPQVKHNRQVVEEGSETQVWQILIQAFNGFNVDASRH